MPLCHYSFMTGKLCSCKCSSLMYNKNLPGRGTAIPRSLSTKGVYNQWTGLVDWTSGLDYWTLILLFLAANFCFLQLVHVNGSSRSAGQLAFGVLLQLRAWNMVLALSCSRLRKAIYSGCPRTGRARGQGGRLDGPESK